LHKFFPFSLENTSWGQDRRETKSERPEAEERKAEEDDDACHQGQCPYEGAETSASPKSAASSQPRATVSSTIPPASRKKRTGLLRREWT